MAQGPPTVLCFMCGRTVTKRSTIALRDGRRACRTHEGIMAEAQARHQQQEAKLGLNIFAPEDGLKCVVRRCSICGCMGVSKPDIACIVLDGQAALLRSGIGLGVMEAFELAGVSTFRAMEDHKVATLEAVPYGPNKDVLDRTMCADLFTASLIGLGLICRACCVKHGLKSAASVQPAPEAGAILSAVVNAQIG